MLEIVTNALRFLGIMGYGDGSWVKFLLHTPKNQNSEPQHPQKRHGYVCCNPSFWEVKEQNPGSYWPATPAKSDNSRFSYRSSLRKNEVDLEPPRRVWLTYQGPLSERKVSLFNSSQWPMAPQLGLGLSAHLPPPWNSVGL